MAPPGLGNRYDLSQALGIVILGAGPGLSLALVEQALRPGLGPGAQRPPGGAVYLLAQTSSALGLDERAEVGLFGDSLIARRHGVPVDEPLARPSATGCTDAGRIRGGTRPLAPTRPVRPDPRRKPSSDVSRMSREPGPPWRANPMPDKSAAHP